MFTELTDLENEIKAIKAAMATQIGLLSRALTIAERATLCEYLDEVVDDQYDHILSPLQNQAEEAEGLKAFKELQADRADYYGRVL